MGDKKDILWVEGTRNKRDCTAHMVVVEEAGGQTRDCAVQQHR